MNNKFVIKLFRAIGGAYGIIMPSFPSKDDRFLIVSIEGIVGASGFIVNNVNFSFNYLRDGGWGGTKKSN